MDRAKRHKPTIEEFRRMCEFPPEQWMMTWEFLAGRLHEPRNAVGLGGPQKGGLHWDSWLDTFLDGGIGKALWGEGANRKWAYPEDRKEIRKFLREIMSALAVRERRFLSKREGSGNPPGASKDPYLSRESSTDSSFFGSYSADNQGSEIHPLPGSRGLPPIGPRNSPLLSPAEELAHLNQAMKRSSPEFLPDYKRSRISNTGEKLSSMMRFHETSSLPTHHHSSPAGINLFQPCPPPMSISSPQHVYASHSSPSGASRSPDLVFKTRLVGSTKTKFLHASDVPTLGRFLEAVASKWRVNAEQSHIRSVMLRVAGEVYDIDPEDERDWGPMMKIAKGSGGIAEIVVEIS